jgi:hypothetical protein
MRHHPDVQLFLEWCKEKGLLTRYRAFLQRQAEHSPTDVKRLMAAIEVGMTQSKWQRARRSNAGTETERAMAKKVKTTRTHPDRAGRRAGSELQAEWTAIKKRPTRAKKKAARKPPSPRAARPRS